MAGIIVTAVMSECGSIFADLPTVAEVFILFPQQPATISTGCVRTFECPLSIAPFETPIHYLQRRFPIHYELEGAFDSCCGTSSIGSFSLLSFLVCCFFFVVKLTFLFDKFQELST